MKTKIFLTVLKLASRIGVVFCGFLPLLQAGLKKRLTDWAAKFWSETITVFVLFCVPFSKPNHSTCTLYNPKPTNDFFEYESSRGQLHCKIILVGEYLRKKQNQFNFKYIKRRSQMCLLKITVKLIGLFLLSSAYPASRGSSVRLNNQRYMENKISVLRVTRNGQDG